MNAVDTTTHPEIGILTGDFSVFCSGTFVSASTMITAAHCVGDSPQDPIYYVPGAKPDMHASASSRAFVQATKVVHLGYTSSDYSDGMPYDADKNLNDLAVVIFPPATAPGVVGIAGRVPNLNETITMLGYGGQKLGAVVPGTYPPIRAVGKNKIVAPPNAPVFETNQLHIGNITQAQSEAAAGTLALMQKGDSGGAMLLDGKLAGVASRMINSTGGTPIYFAAYNSTLGAEADELFTAARLAGAVIPQPGDEPADEVLGHYDPPTPAPVTPSPTSAGGGGGGGADTTNGTTGGGGVVALPNCAAS